jgi:hypothetical protein
MVPGAKVGNVDRLVEAHGIITRIQVSRPMSEVLIRHHARFWARLVVTIRRERLLHSGDHGVNGSNRNNFLDAERLLGYKSRSGMVS